ncbi:MAG: cell wall hydrolase [Oscillospiraceae bacterium]|jgi:N-acetylmuramoyl-L-alanine amidase|nr:cell wall hydrolase [Oscillospiraceae bacterium]
MKTASKIRLCCIILGIALTAALLPGLAADDADGEANRIAVVIRAGAEGEPDETLYTHLIADTAYVPVKAFSVAMGALGVYRDGDRAIVVAPGLELSAAAGEAYVVANGRYLYAPTGLLERDGEIIAPVRPLAAAFGASVYWSGANRSVVVTRGDRPLTAPPYSEDDLYWMARIIKAEAGGEIFLGKLAVGSVIMNRVASPEFPGTVYGVIFDKRFGVQFTPAYSGAIHNTPSQECVVAAKLALEGVDIVGGSLYFSSTTACWAERNRARYGSIQNHIFYL